MSIEEQITQDIVTSLEAVVASSPDYESTFVVERRNRLGNDQSNGVVVIDEPRMIRLETSPLGRDMYQKDYEITISTVVAEGGGVSDGERCAQFAADAMLALTSNAAYTRGGLAINTVVNETTRSVSDGRVSARLSVSVIFWTIKDNPNSQ